ncbi:hypothetical protein CBLAS_0896 [Campylobacter blaseri]|uniref:hypothetical protein n=1 Tax=Campylobacter blaseri TaxID=2042961 RepID=UPI0012FFD69C|nr:hypothetical protein [Campylobacter blaseri]QKF86081.1 hypothetical protein CBLAS_0896 [Campylobacter blaseri]
MAGLLAAVFLSVGEFCGLQENVQTRTRKFKHTLFHTTKGKRAKSLKIRANRRKVRK